MKIYKYLIILSLMLLLSSTYAQEQNFSFYIDGEDIEGAEIDILPIDDSEYVVNKNFIPNGPTVIKDVSRNMKSSGYWISKIKNPDKEILTKEQIKEKNKELFRDLIYLNNIEDFPEYVNSAPLKKQQKQIFNMFYYRKYIDGSFNPISKDYVNKVYNNIKIPKSKKLQPKYAIATSYTDIRLLPSDINFLYDETTYDIDRAQVSGIDTGTPLIVLLSTKDGIWNYVISYNCEGWVKSKDIAFTTSQVFLDWINENKFVIVTSTKADIYTDKQMTRYCDYIRMSAKFPLLENTNKEIVCVKIPKRTSKGNLIFDKAYLYEDDINEGYLKYTQKNILQQAFKHLNSPYSWGGYNGEQDCSTFIRQVFGCFGLILPRNSLAQIKSGNKQINLTQNLSDSEKSKEIISKTTPAISLLYLPGHIMLYIGNEKDTPYIIHAIWGTEHFVNKKESVVSFINKVVVSNLNIGENTSKGSLLQRIKKVNTLTLRK